MEQSSSIGALIALTAALKWITAPIAHPVLKDLSDFCMARIYV
jgi:hypothetical protein